MSSFINGATEAEELQWFLSFIRPSLQTMSSFAMMLVGDMDAPDAQDTQELLDASVQRIDSAVCGILRQFYKRIGFDSVELLKTSNRICRSAESCARSVLAGIVGTENKTAISTCRAVIKNAITRAKPLVIGDSICPGTLMAAASSYGKGHHILDMSGVVSKGVESGRLECAGCYLAGWYDYVILHQGDSCAEAAECVVSAVRLAVCDTKSHFLVSECIRRSRCCAHIIDSVCVPLRRRILEKGGMDNLKDCMSECSSEVSSAMRSIEETLGFQWPTVFPETEVAFRIGGAVSHLIRQRIMKVSDADIPRVRNLRSNVAGLTYAVSFPAIMAIDERLNAGSL